MDKINKIKIKDVTYEIGGGGSSATVDSGLSSTSENAVQNKVITSELGKKLDKSGFTTTNKSAVVKYNNFGGAYLPSYDSDIIKPEVQYTGATFTAEVIDKASLCKIVGFTKSTSLVDITTGLYAIFKAKDLEGLKTTFTNGNAFTAYVCNPPSDQTDKPLYDIYQDLGSRNSMLGKEYVMPLGREHSGYPSDNLLNHNHPTEITNATFASLYATYSGDTSTMFFAPWKEIRNAFVSTDNSWYINKGAGYNTIYIYSSSRVFSYSYGVGYYVKFIDANDFTDNGVGNIMELQANVDHLWGAADLVSMKTDIASNKTKIDSLEPKVVYAEPDSASTAHTFTRTINGEKLYTTDNANRDIKLVTSVNGKTGAVNIQAKTINGESVLGEGEIDMSSYQTKTEAVKIARLTQAEYDALSTKDNNTLYIIITES